MDFDKNELIELIESIGYTQRVDNYYVIRESNGYINISYPKGDGVFDCKISFHKNVYQGSLGDGVSKDFDDYESFVNFINEYHSKLFLKQKLIKITKNINNG